MLRYYSAVRAGIAIITFEQFACPDVVATAQLLPDRFETLLYLPIAAAHFAFLPLCCISCDHILEETFRPN
jgi:hypothetical protein